LQTLAPDPVSEPHRNSKTSVLTQKLTLALEHAHLQMLTSRFAVAVMSAEPVCLATGTPPDSQPPQSEPCPALPGFPAESPAFLEDWPVLPKPPMFHLFQRLQFLNLREKPCVATRGLEQTALCEPRSPPTFSLFRFPQCRDPNASLGVILQPLDGIALHLILRLTTSWVLDAQRP
jgi:hypothetical protein